MATAEGTLVASYNRGMRLLYEAGGVKTTVMADRMQRAPVFTMPSAREARALCRWLDEHFDEIKAAAESTTRSGKLQEIERHPARVPGDARLLWGRQGPQVRRDRRGDSAGWRAVTGVSGRGRGMGGVA